MAKSFKPCKFVTHLPRQLNIVLQPGGFNSGGDAGFVFNAGRFNVQRSIFRI